MYGKYYTLPKLSFEYNHLEPYISTEQLTIHHQKHHQAYVNSGNAILERMDKAREGNEDLDAKSVLKDLSFNIGGHILHTLFWDNLAPAGKDGGGEPSGQLAEKINEDFGSFKRFKKEFSQAAVSTEGSGWAVLTFSEETNRLLIMQIEKHNTNVFPGAKIILVLDVFEHAYYLDYKNERAKFVEAFWSIINWKEVEKRLV